MIFFDSRNLLKHRRVPLWSFPVLWHKEVPTQISHIPLLSLKLFEIRFLPKQRRTSRRSFPVLWDKKFSTENCDIRFSCLKFFETQFFLKHRKVFISDLFRYCDRKQFRQTILLPLPLPSIKFSIVEFFSNTARFLYKVFRNGKIKKFQHKLVTSRAYVKICSIPELFWDTEGLL